MNNDAGLGLGVIALGVIAISLNCCSAHAQQALLTIADCPAGYTLGIADTNEPQMAIAPPDNSNQASWQRNQSQQQQAQQQPPQSTPSTDTNAAPRRFMTGCIPPQNHK